MNKIVNNLASRKLGVFVIATVLLCFKMITSENWVQIAFIVVGFNSVDKFTLKGKDEPK